MLIFDDAKGHFKEDLSKNENKSNLITNFNNNLFDRLKKCGQGKKLRTYKIFKTVICFEKYLDILNNQGQRKLYSRFRLSSHNLEIKKGRYRTNSIPADQRICKLCNEGKVKDEFHFLMQCPFYLVERTSLLEHIHVCRPKSGNGKRVRSFHFWV